MREIDAIVGTFKVEVDKTEQALRQGKVILYPTDTIWGLGCDATNKSAVERIYEIKKRERNNPLIILVDSISMLKKYVASLHPRIETLLSYHTRPLTIIYSDVQNLPQHILAEDGSAARRICKEAFCKAIIQAFGRPIVSTSANLTGQPYPSNFEEIDPILISEVDHVVSNVTAENLKGEPSIIASYNKKGELQFLRE